MLFFVLYDCVFVDFLVICIIEICDGKIIDFKGIYVEFLKLCGVEG